MESRLTRTYGAKRNKNQSATLRPLPRNIATWTAQYYAVGDPDMDVQQYSLAEALKIVDDILKRLLTLTNEIPAHIREDYFSPLLYTSVSSFLSNVSSSYDGKFLESILYDDGEVFFSSSPSLSEPPPLWWLVKRVSVGGGPDLLTRLNSTKMRVTCE